MTNVLPFMRHNAITSDMHVFGPMVEIALHEMFDLIREYERLGTLRPTVSRERKRQALARRIEETALEMKDAAAGLAVLAGRFTAQADKGGAPF